MRRTLLSLTAAVTLLAWIGSAGVGLTGSGGSSPSQRLDESGKERARAEATRDDKATRANAVQALGRLGPRFEANRGQVDPDVDFVSHNKGYSLFLSKTGATMAVGSAIQAGSNSADVVRMGLVGARSKPKVVGKDALAGVSNYLTGNDPKRWVIGVPQYAKVTYEGVYPGVDLIYRGDDQGRLEYDFILAPGADPASIILAFTGGKGLRLEDSGELVIATAAGDVRQHKPTLFQDLDGKRTQVPGRYVMRGSHVGFEVGDYDRNLPLVIDPVLVYSTYLGGNGPDEATGIAVDREGHAYVVGTTTSTDFPGSEGSHDTTCGADANCGPNSNGSFPPNGGSVAKPDAFVTKLAPDGTYVLYSTYLGGKDHDEGLAIALDADKRAYIAGRTKSADFPTTANAYDRECGTDAKCNFRLTDKLDDDPSHGQTKADAFVAKLNPAGSGLDYSTFFGGSGDDTRAGHMNFRSTPLNDYEPGDEVEATERRGSGTTAGSRVLTAHGYLGATAGIAVVGQTVYLTSSTASTDLPTTASAYDDDCGTGDKGDCNEYPWACEPLCYWVSTFTDQFLAQLDTTLAPDKRTDGLRYSSYFGGSEDDVATGIAVTSASGPTRAYLIKQGGSEHCIGCFSKCFIECVQDRRPPPPAPARVDFATLNSVLPQQGGSQSLWWSTSPSGSVLSAIAVDSSGSPWVTGSTEGGLTTTAGAFQTTKAGRAFLRDAFLTKLSPNGPTLAYSTYLGGDNGEEVGRGVAVDGTGRVFVTGETSSFDEPHTTDKDEAFPTKDSVQPSPKCVRTTSDCENLDAFVTGIDPSKPGASALVYSTYLGGKIPGGTSPAGPGRRDVGRGIALSDGSSTPSVYVTGLAISSDFPLVAPYQNGNAGATEGFVAKIIPGLEAPPPELTVVAPLSGPSSGGTPVVLTGKDLVGATAVRFGAQAVPCPSSTCALNAQGTQLSVVSPPLFDEANTTVDISVTTPGGNSRLTPDAKFAYHDGAWNATGSPAAPPLGPAAVLDDDDCRTTPPASYCGKVLFAGGGGADLYDPKTATWSSKVCTAQTTPSPSCPGAPKRNRDNHTVTLLSDGTVLVAGGAFDGLAELYNSRTGTWTDAGNLNFNRSRHTATLLTGPNCGFHCGKVLVIGGGMGSGLPAIHTAELYDPKEKKWSPAGVLQDARHGSHTATLLSGPNCGSNCGKVLVTGGDATSNAGERAQPAVEIYDPTLDRFETEKRAETGFARIGHTATLLDGPYCRINCGKVLVVGGVTPAVVNNQRVSTPVRVVELYDPSVSDLSKAFSTHSVLRNPRAHHAAVPLPGGRVLVAGGSLPLLPPADQNVYSTEVFDPRLDGDKGAWRPGEPIGTGRQRPAAALLAKGTGAFEADTNICGTNCGKVLLAGGTMKGSPDVTLASAELYTPAPALDDINPRTGPGNGATSVAVSGVSFGQDPAKLGTDIQVRFGNGTLACSGAGARCQVHTHNAMSATAPPTITKDAKVDIWIIRAGIAAARSPGQFTYQGCANPIAGVGQVRYPAGWSLVSLPGGTMVPSESPLYSWFNVGRGGQYSTHDPASETVRTGLGYWAWFSCPRVVDITGATTEQLSFNLDRYRASMVGNPSATKEVTVSGHDYAARWDPAINDYRISGFREAQRLKVGEGIWVFAYTRKTITIR